MSWVIKVSSNRLEIHMNAAVITSFPCSITVTPCHMMSQLGVSPNADRTTSDRAGSIPACLVEQAWQNVLSDLVGV